MTHASSIDSPGHIVILGGGTAGWVCGAILGKRASELGRSVTVLDTVDIPTIGVGEASIPTIYDLLSFVGIDDSELVSSAQATFKYGIQFEGWSRPGSSYMHGFGTTGTAWNNVEFFSAWLGAAQYFTGRDLAPFTPAIVAAHSGRFARVANRPPGAPEHLYYPLAELSYALHFDAALLARLLRDKALQSGVNHLSKRVVDVERSDAGIGALITEDGERIEADHFVDCSGLYGFLSRKTLQSRFDDWQEFLPCDQAVAVQTTRSGEPPLFTRSIAHRAGWRWEIQLQERTGNGMVFSSEYMSEDEAVAHLLDSIDGEPITTPRTIPFRTGRLAEPWTGNCTAIGLSAGFLEPLESTSIHLICKYARLLEASLGSDARTTDAPAKFNAEWRRETEEIRDFLMAHYVVNERPEPFWQARRDGPKPASLVAALSGLAERGWIDLPAQALFGHDSWYQVLIGQQFPLDYAKFALPGDQAKAVMTFLQNVGAAVASEVSRIPRTHADMLAELRSTRL